jgi:hypothetical protein
MRFRGVFGKSLYKRFFVKITLVERDARLQTRTREEAD